MDKWKFDMCGSDRPVVGSMKKALKKRCAGFSLVEVALALGLVSFCLLALVGLLPMGLGTIKTSTNEAAAINCLEQIAGSIRGSTVQASGTDDHHYQASGAYKNLAWSLGGTEFSATLSNLSASGFPDSDTSEQRFTAHIQIKPPADAFSTGTASISVAWPVQATWNSTKSDWQNAQGAVHTWLVFSPNP